MQVNYEFHEQLDARGRRTRSSSEYKRGALHGAHDLGIDRRERT